MSKLINCFKRNRNFLRTIFNRNYFFVVVFSMLFLTTTLLINAQNLDQVVSENQNNINILEKYTGIYEGQDDKYVMRLGLFCEGDIIYGWHKSVLPAGQRADIVNDQTISIVGKLEQDNVLKVDFISGYTSDLDRGIGSARITMIDENTISFKILSKQGESYIPSEIKLSKIGTSENAPTMPLYIDDWSIVDLTSKRQISFRSTVNDFIEVLGSEKATSLYLDKGATSGIIYYYDGIEILASNSKEDIMYFYITSSQYVVSKNLKVGDDVSKLINSYPAIVPHKAKKGSNVEIYTYNIDKEENIKSIFEVENGVIKSIRLSYI